MYPLIRQYLRRVDAPYLALCVLCSALSVVALVSLGQSQLGSNNKASVQLIASLLGVMLAIVFSTVDYRALARAIGLTMQGSIDNAIRNFLAK